MKKVNIHAFCFLLFCTIAFSTCKHQPKLPEGFEINPAFNLERVAIEPLVFDPVDMKFDATGRAFVLEMPGYPFSEAASRIVLLEDEDEDGIFDKRTVFAENLGVASSFMPYKGGFLVAAPPDLLWLKDTDQDDKADEREALMSGFEVGNLQHNYNGLTYGLDNWIYAANGGNNGKPFYTGQETQALDLRGEDFRFRLEDQSLERVGESSGGFELAFDNWGNMYETHNLEHVSQLVFPGYYTEGLPIDPAHTLTNISDHEENGLSRIYPIGEQETRVNHPEQSGYFSGACGITFYGGQAFPETYNNNLFIADVVLNLVHLDVLSENKAAFKASRMREKVEFLASSDRSFRPVNLTTGPDGALYLIDMHRAVIEHPEWIPDEIEATLDLEAGKDKGRIYRITPKENWKSSTVSLNPNNPESLVAALEHKNQWHRMTAQRLIVASQDESFKPLLESLLSSSSNALAHLHALWSLEGLGALDTKLLQEAFKNSSSGLKVNAIEIAEKHINEEETLIPEILQLMADESAQVSMQAALCLSRLSPSIYTKNEEAIKNSLLKLLERNDIDQWTAMAAAALARAQAANFVQALFETPLNEHQELVASSLLRLIGEEQSTAGLKTILASLSNNAKVEEAKKALLIDALAQGWNKAKLAKKEERTLTPIMAKIETTASPSLVKACGRLRNALQLPVSEAIKQQIREALIVVKSQKLDLDRRMELLQLIELEDFDKRSETLYSLLDNREPKALQEEVLWQLWRANEPAVGPKLVEMWPNLGPDARKKASDILLYKTFNHDVLLTALETGKINMGEMNFDLERRRTLLWWSETDEVKRRAEALFSDAGVVTRKEAIEKMRPALDLVGNIESGETQFINLCSQCHQYGKTGKDVGPVLTEINRKSKESLLYEILDPNAAVDTKYINHQAKTKDGNIYTGIIAEESDSEIVLKMMGGQEQRINKNNLEQLTSLGISLMPEGQEANMSTQEMADLLAYLQQRTL